MKRAGFVLAGGASSRMGRDKALLPYGRATLIEHVAAQVAAAAGSAALVGPPARYARLGYPVIPDCFRGGGPLAGIQAALAASPAQWNLVVACDMPGVTAEFLQELLAAAEASGAEALVPQWPRGWVEPLCAVYRRELAAPLREALRRGERKAAAALAALRVAWWPIREPSYFENLNTPRQWARRRQARVQLPHASLLSAGAP
jgi:molybdopterin-guanine dinucleotide biosynthesis protein A